MSQTPRARALNQLFDNGPFRPSGGLAISSGALRETAKQIGKDELTIPRLSGDLPVPTGNAANILEKLIGKHPELTSLPDAIARILLASRAVVHVTTPSGPGTGFMIGPGLVMTNNHVLVGVNNERDATPADATLTLTFNYEQGLNGQLATIEQAQSDPKRFFAADRELDFAVIGVMGDPGEKWVS